MRNFIKKYGKTLAVLALVGSMASVGLCEGEDTLTGMNFTTLKTDVIASLKVVAGLGLSVWAVLLGIRLVKRGFGAAASR